MTWGSFRSSFDLGLAEGSREGGHAIIAALLKLRVIGVTQGRGVRALALEGSQSFGGFRVAALGHLDMIGKAFPIACASDGIALIHFFRKRWNMFHEVLMKGRRRAAVVILLPA